MPSKLDLIEANSTKEIKEKLFLALDGYKEILPVSKKVSVLIKPNLNSNMNALTGNTTDLRVLAVVIEYLKENGYRDITIGEGTNSGYYRNEISVISRLAVDKLAEYYEVKVVDLNYSEKVEIGFQDGVMAGIAKECLDADFFINMPKLKTHFEVGMSVCLKNLMGCLVGQENKKKTHKNLARNILNINKHVKPHLHIVDGIIAMEGLGPTRGTPVNTGLIIIGTDPYLIDLVCSRVAGFDYRKTRTLKLAADEGIVTRDHHRSVDALNLSGLTKRFQEPKANPLVSFIHSPKRQQYFLAIRNAAIFNYLCSTRFIGNILFWTGLRQDNFIKEEMSFEGFTFNRDLCQDGCTKCMAYCPVGIKLPDNLERDGNGCIHCLYCYLVCPEKAIEFKGKLGFVAEQLRQYNEVVRKIT
jgi:uncharacterized protein (DUF362 family)/NAD-dependent dihydropyrimidine dehydrogenase PreA subunit